MSGWKMVPIVPTTDMWAAAVPYQDSFGFAYREALAAAPKWEPSEDCMTRAMAAWITSYRRRESADASLRAAILAAVGGHDE